MNFDELIRKYKGEVRKLTVGEVDFSGYTYQVQVVDGEEELWPFVQWDRDAFCSCEKAETGCAHLAAALVRIVGDGVPLHERFEKSLWNVLCRVFGERQGYEPGILAKKGELYVLETMARKRLFEVEGKSEEAKKRLEVLIEKRVRETEENSLKFSGLSTDELALWREGRPSEELRYELSFWSDLAKWMMLEQDRGGGYQVSFGYGERGLPNWIGAEFEEIRVGFYVSEANLLAVLPALKTVESPLAVHDLQDEAIESIGYDAELGALMIRANEEVAGEAVMPRGDQEGVVVVDDWLFVPGEGFTSREQHALLHRPVVPAKEVGALLDEHAKTVARHLVGVKFHSESVTPSYTIGFDKEWNLHVRCYLFNPGDLQEGQSRTFCQWAYLDDDGFYKMEGALFDEVERVVPADEVSDFVHRHRVWLNGQEGFHTHLTSVESQLSYEVTDRGDLCFESRVELPEGAAASRDFGEWVYISGQGFYSKAHGRSGSPLRAGARVARDEVPLFIQVNRDELELVNGFFGAICPIAKGALKISLTAREQVKVRPKYELHSGFKARDVRFYDPFVYVRGEGFCEIPMELRLPERFARPLVIKGQELALFLNYELQALAPYISQIDPRLARAEPLRLKLLEAKWGEGGHSGALALKVRYESPVGSVDVLDIHEVLGKRRKTLFSDAGLLDLGDRRFQWLRQLPPGRVDEQRSLIWLTSLEFMRLIVLEGLSLDEVSEETECLYATFSRLEPSETPDVTGLTSTLRPYQEVGARWLWFLYQNHLSGLLCDDMGLGKTHQAMALLAASTHKHRDLSEEERPLYLVVCPTSVIYHWREKLAQFLPSLRVYTFYGAQRTLTKLNECDVLLTSYGVLRSERNRLTRIAFEVAIFDEIQVAKNTSSLTHEALTKVRAHMRLGLTGTPIENNLRELKALFDIVLPTYLPPERHFRQYFVLPIEKERDRGRQAVLRQVIKPFLLRRKKEEVLTELPEKTEEKAHCELSKEQRRLYNEMLERNQKKLLQQLKDEQTPAPYLHVFAVLSALKQICDHPAVHLKTAAAYKEHNSGKWDLFCELLSQARESRQKVVVFSQYLAMLDIIESHLRESGIGYAAIRGSTSARDEELKRFERDPKCEVFVGSLQAVGLGVELTAASVVIHYDRWWNAARERQATDRVHRLGQTRGVQVFKLLTLGTIEERIDALIERKGELMEEVVGSDEQGQIKAFSREELIELLTLVDFPVSDSE